MQKKVMSKVDLAGFLSVSTVTIDDWVRAGCPYVKKGGNGRKWEFSLSDVVNWRIACAENSEGQKVLDYKELEKEKLYQEVQKLKIQNAKLKGDLLDASSVEHAMIKNDLLLRKAILSLPQRASLRLDGCQSRAEYRQVLEDECIAFLEYVSDGIAEVEFDIEECADEDI